MNNQTIAACVREYRTAGSWAGVDKATSLDAQSKSRLAACASAHVSKSSHAVAAIFRASGPVLVSAAPSASAVDYNAMTVDELYALGKGLGLSVTTKLRKAELIAILEASA